MDKTLVELLELIEDGVEDLNNLRRHADLIRIDEVYRILKSIKDKADQLMPNAEINGQAGV